MYNDVGKEKSEKINDIISKINTLKNRSKIENYIRSLLLDENYVEVRTPIINRYADIAPINQFKVNSPIEDKELYLRIAPTEQLKKLIFYGFDRIFEFSTNFRSDEIDSKHLFEFTSLEIMDKNKTVFDKMYQTEKIIKRCIEFCKNENMPISKSFYNTSKKEWSKINIIDYLYNRYNIDIYENNCLKDLKELYKNLYNDECCFENKYAIINKIVDYIGLVSDIPTFIGNFPWEIEGPAKLNKKGDGKERYELYYKGIEIANMSSTLINPIQLKKWYFETMDKKNKTENKNYIIDPDLLNIFEKMPESAVVGLGIDRLIMLLLGKDKISDVVCFDNKEKIKVKKIGGIYENTSS